MFETTPPPQKALKHYSQAPWLLICLLFFASPLLGQSCPQPSTGNTGFDQTQQFLGTTAGQKFGGSLAMNGHLKVVGSPAAGNSQQGEVEVFRKAGSQWLSVGLLNPQSPLQAGERFGASVDVDADANGDELIVVSTRPVSTVAGLVIKVSVFRNGILEATLTEPTQPLGGSYPGSSVAVDDETIVIGVPDASGGGAALIYRHNTGNWILDNDGEILATDLISQNPSGPVFQHFGTWVDIEGEQVVIGDPYATVNGSGNAGAAYLLHRNNGVSWLTCGGTVGPLTGAGSANEGFGGSVAISGDVIVIGAANYSGGGTGSAFVFRRLNVGSQPQCNWTLEQQLFGSTGQAGDAFGRAVAIETDFPDAQQPFDGSGRIVVGALMADIVGPNSGTAYVYDYASSLGNPGWTEVAELQPNAPASDDRFGANVAIANCTIGVAAHLSDVPASNAGSTTLFLAPECDDCVEVIDVTMVADPSIQCGSSVTLDLENLSGCELVAAQVSIVYPFNPPPPPPLPTVSPNAISLGSVQPSDLFQMDLLIGGTVANSCICLEIIFRASDGSVGTVECCRKTVCVRTAQVGCADCNGNGVLDTIDISSGYSEDCNLNGVPDECDIANGTSLDIDGDGIPDECVQFIRGDTNADGICDLADAINLLCCIFPNVCTGYCPCDDASDVNDSGIVDIADVIYKLNYLFAMGPPPPSPFPGCGYDPTPDPLGCASFPPCP